MIRGRVGSLLEVGTGFHPELTGRENVYLNGSVLGMKRREIARKFAEIVEFAGVEKFIDTPVKRYSSGMSVRLAFAVAAHLEPEVLLVDEVLAVGDAEFQRRCLGRMEDLSQSGRTVLFVSHNMQAVSQLCDRAILLDEGRIVLDGSERGRRRGVSPVRATAPGRAASGPISKPHLATSSFACARSGSSRTTRRPRLVDVRQPIGIEIGFTVLRHGERRSFPKIKVFDQQGDVAFNALDTSPRWQEPADAGRVRLHRVDPREPAQRGPDHRRRRRLLARRDEATPPRGVHQCRLVSRARPG